MIRSLMAQDAAALARICHDALGHAGSPEWIRQRILQLGDKDEYRLTAWVDEDNTVKGFLQAQKYQLLYGTDGWNIIALAVLPEAQRRGIGKALLTALEEHAKEDGASFIRLNSRLERAEAHGFYEHMGYCCDKTQKRFIKYL